MLLVLLCVRVGVLDVAAPGPATPPGPADPVESDRAPAPAPVGGRSAEER
ncbi:hypothetical protein ACX6XY_01800 [Streptomyces sp. O3]